MPLENAAVGTPGFGRNIKREIEAGKPQKQAVAIAYAKARGDAATHKTGDKVSYEKGGKTYHSTIIGVRQKNGQTVYDLANNGVLYASDIADSRGDAGSLSEQTEASREVERCKKLLRSSKTKKEETEALKELKSARENFNRLSDSAVDANTGYTEIWCDGTLDQTIDHNGNYKAIIQREAKDLREMGCRVTLKHFNGDGSKMARLDGADEPTTLDSLLAEADGLYTRSDEMQNGKWSEQAEKVVDADWNESDHPRGEDGKFGAGGGGSSSSKKGESMSLAQARKAYNKQAEKNANQLRRDLANIDRKYGSHSYSASARDKEKAKQEAMHKHTMANNKAAEELLWWRPEYQRKDSAQSEGKVVDAQKPYVSHLSGRAEVLNSRGSTVKAFTRASHGADYKEAANRYLRDNFDRLRSDAAPTTLDSLLADADEMFAKADAVSRDEAIEGCADAGNYSEPGPKSVEQARREGALNAKQGANLAHSKTLMKKAGWPEHICLAWVEGFKSVTGRSDSSSPQPGDQVTIKKEVFERMRKNNYQGPRVVRVKEYRGGELVLTSGWSVKPADVD